MTFRLLGALFAVMGAGLAGFGILATRQARRFTRVAQRAPGRVVGHKADDYAVRPGDVNLLIHPIVEYRAGDGRPVSFEHPVGRTSAAFSVGEEVTVMYDPAHPENARIETGWGASLAPVLFTLFGVVFGAVGLGVFLLAPPGAP